MWWRRWFFVIWGQDNQGWAKQKRYQKHKAQAKKLEITKFENTSSREEAFGAYKQGYKQN